MDIFALDRAVTDRPVPGAPLAGAEGDLFDQMLTTLTEVADPYGDDGPVDDEAPDEPTDHNSDTADQTAEQTGQQLTALGQLPVEPESTPVEPESTPVTATTAAAPADADTPRRQADETKVTAPAAGTEQPDPLAAATTVAATAPSPQAAAAQPALQRAVRQSGQEQAQQNTPINPLAAPADQVSLRAGRDEALTQGNGQFSTSAANADSPGKAAPTPTDTPDEQLTKNTANAERPALKAEVAQPTPRPETPVLENPKPIAPLQSSPFAATTASTAGTPLDPAGQFAANGRAGDAQSIAAAKQSTASRAAAESRLPPAQQIAVHVRNGLKAGADTIHVRLNPAELGRVEVRMQIDGDKNIQTLITVEKAETLESLQRDARTLQRALEDAGFRSDPDSFTFQHDQSASNQDDQASGGRLNAAGGDSAEDATESSDTTDANRRSSHDGIVDIEV